MKSFNLFSSGKGILMFSLCTLFLLSFIYIPTESDTTAQEEITPQEIVEDFSHCPALFPSVNLFCAGSYQITGYLPSGNGCVFHWIGSANCQGISANVTQTGNQIQINGSGTAGSFCKFRYKITDDHGLTFYYIVGVRIRQASDPLCCPQEPCQ